jgi:uncharacterized protein
MSEQKVVFSWHDLTVGDADKISEFYCAVAGWNREPFDMGDYVDYIMKDDAGNVVAGICNAKGPNAYLPPQWLSYIQVNNLDESLEKCISLGGKIVGDKRSMGPNGKYCLIEDPSGAYLMLAEGSYSG